MSKTIRVSDEGAEAAKDAVEALRDRDGDRLDAAREAFTDGRFPTRRTCST